MCVLLCVIVKFGGDSYIGSKKTLDDVHVDPTHKNVWLEPKRYMHFFPIYEGHVDTTPDFRGISLKYL